MRILIFIFKPIASAGFAVGLLALGSGYYAFKNMFEFISAFWVMPACILAILFAGMIALAFIKSRPGRVVTILAGIALIIGVFVAKPTIINGHITSDYLGHKYERALYDAGVKHLDKEEYTDAIATFSKVITHYETRLKEYHEHVGDTFNKAILSGSTASMFIFNANTKSGVLESTDLINSYFLRGHAYRDNKQYDEAILDYEMVERLIPDIRFKHLISQYYPAVYASIGDAYGADEKYDKAASYYAEYLKQKPPDEPETFRVDTSNPSDMWFCAVLWKKKLSTKEAKYETWIQQICDRNEVTPAEIEAFYKQNRASLEKPAFDLFKNGYTGGVNLAEKLKEPRVYHIGEKTETGGFVFYDKGDYRDGWRYLEAAPRDQKNLEALEPRGLFAERYRLPTKDELNLMYENLKKNKVGGFSNSLKKHYRSSTAGRPFDSENTVWCQSFRNGWQTERRPRKDWQIIVIRGVREF
jgi:tetratricopeptide (TPR) repeat protein